MHQFRVFIAEGQSRWCGSGSALRETSAERMRIPEAKIAENLPIQGLKIFNLTMNYFVFYLNVFTIKINQKLKCSKLTLY